jgi:hypothetical protein
MDSVFAVKMKIDSKKCEEKHGEIIGMFMFEE